MPTKETTIAAPSPADRLAAAQAAEQAARDALTELRERHKTGDTVSASEFGNAGHAVELAELERQGAEDALAEYLRQERFAKLAEISADIAARAQSEGAAEAFERAAAALADLITACGPARARMIESWRHQLRALGVQPTRAGQELDPEDGGLGWRDIGWGGTPTHVIRDGRAIRRFDLAQLLAGIVASACRQANVPPALFGIAHPPPGLAEDPAAWLAR